MIIPPLFRYINDPNNLKIMMNLLRGNTKAIQFEAFHGSLYLLLFALPRLTCRARSCNLRSVQNLRCEPEEVQAGR